VYLRRNKLGDGLKQMQDWQRLCKIQNGANTKDVAMGPGSDVIVGNFVDLPTDQNLDFLGRYETMAKAKFDLPEDFRYNPRRVTIEENLLGER
jgi:hypothetical protein